MKISRWHENWLQWFSFLVFVGFFCDSFLPAPNTLGTLRLSNDDRQLKIKKGLTLSVPLGLPIKYRAHIYHPMATEAPCHGKDGRGTESGVWLGHCPCHGRWASCPPGTGESPVLSDSPIFPSGPYHWKHCTVLRQCVPQWRDQEAEALFILPVSVWLQGDRRNFHNSPWRH